MSKTDWENNKLPFFNSNKYGTIVDGELADYRYLYTPSATPADSTPSPSSVNNGQVQNFMPYFVDGSDALANRGFIVSFQHTPSDEDVSFKAFITAFNETYNSDWSSEVVYGRADPIYMFKNTQREITLALNLPAATESEAFENLGRVQRLITFLYPTYKDLSGAATEAGNQRDTVNALTIANSPLVRLRIMNILASRPQIGDMRHDQGAENQSQREAEGDVRENRIGTFAGLVGGSETAVNTSAIGSQTISNNFHGGVLGVIKNLTVNHNLENPDYGVFQVANGTILPKMIEINLSFGVIHEHTLGWLPSSAEETETGQTFSNILFPYGVNHTADMDPNTSVMSAGANASLTGSSDARFSDLNDQVDQFQEEQEMTEQDRQNAQARYAGARGKARFRKDQEAVATAAAGISIDSSRRERRQYNRASRRAAGAASAVRGVENFDSSNEANTRDYSDWVT